MAFMLLMLAMAAAGCASIDVTQIEPNEQSKLARLPVTVSKMEHATHWQLQGQWSRVASEMDRTTRDVNWALLNQTPQPPQRRDVMDGEPTHARVDAKALRPDGTEVDILCWPGEGDVIYITIQAGPFGDAKEEARFAAQLQKNLKKKPVPVRGSTFRLPEMDQ